MNDPQNKANGPLMPPTSASHGRIVTATDETQCLTTDQLGRLEQAFREWAENTPRGDVRLSRRRILLIFLLIRYTGAKLNEVLALDPFNDMDHESHWVVFHGGETRIGAGKRKIPLSETLSHEIKSMLDDPEFRDSLRNRFNIDPGFVRRKFYDRAKACGFSQHLGGPEMLRKARAVEWMQNNMPLPVVQTLLGHSTPNLTTSYVSFSDEEMQQVTHYFMEKESSRKTSARNSFFGKIDSIQKGDIQSRVVLTTLEGHQIATVITNDSAERLVLKEGKLITAEVKAPWVILEKISKAPESSAENQFQGIIARMNKGKVNAECVVRISEGTELCSIITTESIQRLGLKEGDGVCALFNCFSVVLHAD